MDLDGFGAADVHDVQDVQVTQIANEMGAPRASAPGLWPLRAVWEVDPEGDEPDAPAEDRLAWLAGAFGPLRRVLAAIAERLVATKAYERLCYARLGDYARERPGRSARQLQELARVHRALLRLPALERALVSNELAWSKVRLVARVATAQDAWIARARAVSTGWLEAEVRSGEGSGRAEDPREAPPERWVELRCTPAVREKWSLARELAERVAGERLRDAEALELVTAEVFSALSIDPPFLALLDEPPPTQRRSAEDAGPREETRPPWVCARRLPLSIASLASRLHEADAFELDRRLRLASASSRRSTRRSHCSCAGSPHRSTSGGATTRRSPTTRASSSGCPAARRAPSCASSGRATCARSFAMPTAADVSPE